jgi:hypothetical protein
MGDRDDMSKEKQELLVICREPTEGCPRMRGLSGKWCHYAEPTIGGALCHFRLVQQDVVSRLNVGGHCF